MRFITTLERREPKIETELRVHNFKSLLDPETSLHTVRHVFVKTTYDNEIPEPFVTLDEFAWWFWIHSIHNVLIAYNAKATSCGMRKHRVVVASQLPPVEDRWTTQIDCSCRQRNHEACDKHDHISWYSQSYHLRSRGSAQSVRFRHVWIIKTFFTVRFNREDMQNYKCMVLAKLVFEYDRMKPNKCEEFFLWMVRWANKCVPRFPKGASRVLRIRHRHPGKSLRNIPRQWYWNERKCGPVAFSNSRELVSEGE